MEYFDLTVEYIDKISELYVNAFNAPPWCDSWTTLTAAKRLNQMINCEGAYGLVCCENDKILGMILGSEEQYYNGVHFNIKEFCVDNSIRGKGIGTRLFEEFERRLKNKGIDQIILFTSKGDETEGFYKKRGLCSYDAMVLMGKKLIH
jgi:predicted N-acetyltransferase YhbS